MLKELMTKIFTKPASVLSADLEFPQPEDYNAIVQRALDQTFQIRQPLYPQEGAATDAVDDNFDNCSQYQVSYPLSPELISWYGGQGFIGYQLCAIIAQNWLVREACFLPAREAIKKWFDVTVNDGTQIDAKIKDAIRQTDEQYEVHRHLKNFIGKGRVFGIRIVMFKVQVPDPREYYENPFNPDNIKPGSYLGMVQVDPYWITPELDSKSAGDPSSLHFYEPTWWRVNGMRIHRTHLVIYRTEEVEDILKPTYYYGGISIVQKIMELVYNTLRTANEAPMLVMTKRLQALKIDLDAAVGQGTQLAQRMKEWAYLRNNFGVKIIGLKEDVQQLDTSLTDLDTTLMSQEQLVASAANVPVTKLFKSPPKGFDATGEYDETSWHEHLEELQVNDLTRLLKRHYLFVIKSDIAPAFGITPFPVSITWKPLDTMTAEQLANKNKIKSETYANLANTGAIDGQDIRDALVDDPESGFSGINPQAPEPEPLPDDNTDNTDAEKE